jgi:hypothetical protein
MAPINKVELQFSRFDGVSEAEIKVLFEHKVIPYEAAVESILNQGPGLHKDLILRNFGKDFLEKGDWRAYFIVKGWVGMQPNRHEKGTVQQYLLGALRLVVEAEAMVEGIIKPEHCVLLAKAQLIVENRQTIFYFDENLNNLQSGVNIILAETAFLWTKKEEIKDELRQPIDREVIEKRLKLYGLKLSVDPNSDWPIVLA